MTTSKEVKEGYISTLADLTFNSKPLINVLTMLADENVAHAADIVEAIESHLVKVRTEIKLPVLYLIDCIIKNVGATYTTLFCQNIVTTFCSVFEVVDEKTRGEMFKLRQTWNDVLPKSKLYALDVKVSQLDPAWPVITPQPTNSIHLNPKFLHNSAIPKKSPPLSIPSRTLTAPIIANPEALDPVTLDMQKKLIIKQKQLLELQQKKIELELLQTQVKLQEKYKFSNAAAAADLNKVTPKSQNILLKPEVAKQLSTSTTTTVPKNKSSTMSTIMNIRLQGSTGNVVTGVGTKIAPVNSALIAAARPIRDPRLLRHQSASNSVNTNMQLENKTNTSDTLGSNNKGFNNKMSVRANRSEPRLVTNNSNKDNVLQQGKNKTLPRSLSKSNSKQPDSSNKPLKSSRSNSKSSGSEGGSSKGSLSSLDSPTKSKSNKSGEAKTGRSPSVSPTKHKKKENSASRSDKKNEKSSKSSIKSEKDKSPKSDSSPSTFKELKGISKTRNYIRRNREHSNSPELNQDVDLRLTAPPEKQIRLQGDAADEKPVLVGANNDVSGQGMDVDLRQLPGLVTKKRSSTDAIESSQPKKSRSEVFDVLFGNEDTDLRQLPGVVSSPKSQERPPTPPPPIISSKTPLEVEEIKEVKSNAKKESPKTNNLDALRAKLANATNRDKLNKRKPEYKKGLVKSKPAEDVDLRTTTLDDSFSKIIISSADEQCIKAGNMTKEQETALMNKILAQIENQKLKEAKRKDTEENTVNISLQPISDDELDADFSESNSDEELKRNQPYLDKDDRIPDKDERIAPGLSLPPHINQNDSYSKFPRNIERDPRRGNWRGRGGRRGTIRGIRPTRQGPEPWLRPLNSGNGPWRPMANTYINPHQTVFNSEVIDADSTSLDAPEIIEQDNNSYNPSSNQDTPELIVNCSNHDNIRSINIDGIPRDIRYYDETAVAFMNWDDPREISFQNGSRNVIFDDKDVFLLSFNEPYTEVHVNETVNRVRLGGPTREVFVNGQWYECFFGGPGIPVQLADGSVSILKLEGPPPQVKICEKRTDLVAGKVNLIIDAKTVVPVFLDGKVQKFDIDGQIHDLRFVDALRTVLINNERFDVEFGGLPKAFNVRDKKHFIRFSVLPKGIKPGHIAIRDMEGTMSDDSPKFETEDSMDSFPVVNTNEPALPIFTKKRRVPDSPDRNSNSPVLLQNFNNLDMLSSVMSTSLTPTQNQNTGGYQVENIPTTEVLTQSQQEISERPKISATSNPLPPALNINDLFQKLVATGMVTSVQDTVTPVVQVPHSRPCVSKREHAHSMRPVTFNKTETLKIRQPFLIQTLYTGMQCSSCGMRFPPEHSMHYSQHLDWHFRQNRKGKKNIRKAASRRWYYSLSDWKNYEEIEDLEEREKSYFENQQQAQTDGANEETEEEIEIPSVPADPNVQNAKCEVCQDRFEQFYNEEKEEWHLRMATRIDDRIYHPLCYEDYQASLVDSLVEDSVKDDKSEDCIPGLEVEMQEIDKKSDDTSAEIIIDDDESEKLTDSNEKTEEVEEDTKVNDAFPDDDDDDDDDVIINEVVPEKIDLVDDDYRDDDYTVSDMRDVVVKVEPVDDGFIDVEDGVIKMKSIGEIKVKSEQIDADFKIGENARDVLRIEEQMKRMKTDAPHTEVVTFIDGNVEFDSGVTPASGLGGKIKINITKTLPVIPPKENKEFTGDTEKSADYIDPSQPLPPGEEPIQLNLKPALQGVELKKLLSVTRGTELSGLCSIM